MPVADKCLESGLVDCAVRLARPCFQAQQKQEALERATANLQEQPSYPATVMQRLELMQEEQTPRTIPPDDGRSQPVLHLSPYRPTKLMPRPAIAGQLTHQLLSATQERSLFLYLRYMLVEKRWRSLLLVLHEVSGLQKPTKD